ncbi:CgeB family protein [Aquabacterium olei]|nr:glycosyltransferase [Aquabacterium olei]
MWRLGGHWLSELVISRLREILTGKRFELAYVDNGEYVSARVVKLLKKHAALVINYNIDDPTGPRDGHRFAAYRQAVPDYDLLAVVREENVRELHALGAKKVIRVWRSADEVTHAPRPLTAQDHAQWDCDVLFLGTWMPERGPFLLDLIQRGVPLTIQGGGWQKAPEWVTLRKYWRGGPISGDDYAKAIQCAKINLGLLSKGNRDLHTTRSLEIPALGGVLCAERTAEHLLMYEEGVEAIFWSDAAECAASCAELLADEPQRRSVAERGFARYRANKHGNEDVLSHFIARATEQ